ncbi:actin cortical patch SUR7/pH-response regulator pali [Umbelopsis sp. PMI_123]|nr:actin cortical patch SUR7/pH-response regulator pali [Umbelopsis sp. PMI_123]
MIDFIAAFLNFAAFILSLFALLGDISNVGFFRNIYYTRVDLIESSNNILNSITGAIGIPDYITLGAFSLCEGTTGQGITYCSPPKFGFNYQLPGLSGDLEKLMPSIAHQDITSVQAGLFIPAVCLTFLSLIIALFGHFNRLASLCAAFLTLVSFLLTLATFIVEIIAYDHLKSAVGDLHIPTITVSIGPAVWMTLGAAIALFLATCTYFLACICGVGRSKRRRNYTEPMSEKPRGWFGRRV